MAEKNSSVSASSSTHEPTRTAADGPERTHLWLEVQNVRLDTQGGKDGLVSVQLMLERYEDSPVWWTVANLVNAPKVMELASKALAEKKVVMARLTAGGPNELIVDELRIQYVATAR